MLSLWQPHVLSVMTKMTSWGLLVFSVWKWAITVPVDILLTKMADHYQEQYYLWSYTGLPFTINTLRPRQDGRHFADDIFTWIFFNENCCILIKFSFKYVRKGPIDNIMAWRRSSNKPLSEPMMISLLTHICVTRPQWVNNVECISTYDSMFAPSQWERRRYKVTPSLIGWAQTKDQPCIIPFKMADGISQDTAALQVHLQFSVVMMSNLSSMELVITTISSAASVNKLGTTASVGCQRVKD